MSFTPSHGSVRNRLLAALPAEGYERLRPSLEHVPMALRQVLIEPHRPIEHVYFPLGGIVSTVAQTEEGRIEIGLVGREGLVGTAIVLGSGQGPHGSFVQSAGEALRIEAGTLRQALAEHPAIRRPFDLFIQGYMAQMGQTIYANAVMNIEARLARWVLMTQDRIGGDEILLTHDFLAAMLGVRRPGVTTSIHILEGTGMIRNTRGRIVVRDRDKLKDLAGDSYQVAEDEYERLLAEA